ncbi:MAG TPA: ATP-binding protein [Candidatus Eremiobacteraeota bacterium]|nr:MAG: Adaptive-response sensory-kinase SasA [bacterium ADurb.Bin363]HPZ08437.1 ATP-binding protein [Candidatus Eremiobacteraeota bacterium]
MFIIYILIYILLPLAFITTACLAYKYHYEFTKLKENVDVSKDMLSKIIEAKESEEKLDSTVKDVGNFMDKMKTEYEEKINSLENSLALHRVINEIAKEVNQSLELENILQDTLDKILGVTRTEVGLIMLIDKSNRGLNPAAFSGLSPEFIEEIKKKFIKSDTGTRGQAISLGKSIRAKHITDPGSLTGALLTKGSLKSLVTVPLKSKNEVVGIMQVGSYQEGKFSKEDMKLMDSIGNHIGLALYNAGLYETIKNHSEQLEKKNSKLIELEQMKTDLIQLIVHDLKNPLMGIMGYADILLEEEKNLTESQLSALNIIYISSKDLMRMILNLLDISIMEEQRVTLKLDEINIKDIINRNIYEVRPLLLRENKSIKLEIPERLPIIKADKDLIYRIIANLINNAIKYSPPSGIITIGVNYGDIEKWLTVYIADEGEGIPKDYQEKIFDKFIQLEAKNINIHNLRTSRGLGLTFCKLAVDAHGGRIWVESDVGKGSKFCFNLPFIYFPDEEESEK